MRKRAGTWLRDTLAAVMASAMARSTARVKQSSWKYFLPGSLLDLGSNRLHVEELAVAWSASGSSRPSRRIPCSESADLSAPVAHWRPSGCGSTAPWPVGRPAPAERGAPPPPACAWFPPPKRGARCAAPSFRRCTCASSSETAAAFFLL
eukprot:5261190-Pleurochrysis_carterae.AAC.1